MDLFQHYNALYESSIEKIASGAYHRDPMIDSSSDDRFGISAIIRPPLKVRESIQGFLEELKQIDPSQYYYPGSDMHITVMSIISCYEGFSLDQISTSDYSALIKQSIKGIDPFKLELQGITASASGIMIRGFPENAQLNTLRNQLRMNYKNSDLEQSLDKRYTLQTAHATIMRFRKELQHTKTFLAEMENYKNFNFGSFEVNELELVFNDWYHRGKNSKLLGKFKL